MIINDVPVGVNTSDIKYLVSGIAGSHGHVTVIKRPDMTNKTPQSTG